MKDYISMKKLIISVVLGILGSVIKLWREYSRVDKREEL